VKAGYEWVWTKLVGITMRFKFVAKLVTFVTLVGSGTGCYSTLRGPVRDVPPESGVWHLEYTGDGEESQDYKVAFKNNGDIIVFEGDVRHDPDGRRLTNNTTPGVADHWFDGSNHWERGVAVIHTLQEFSTTGFLAAREYTLTVQDNHTLVGQVVATTRVNGILTRSTYGATARFVRAAL
jgi:hypothetical protein